MNRIWAILFCILIVLSLPGCKKQAVVLDTIEGGMKTYVKMSDGTWKCDGHTYGYRLEISGKMPNAVKDSTFVYLSNIRNISFAQAYKASGVSSNSEDYFSPEEAVLVEIR